jgi:hypothetical protein
MDGKRRINPQNPARKIFGRKQKKQRLPADGGIAKELPDAAPTATPGQLPGTSEGQ